MERLPQVLINVPDVDKSRVETSAELAAAVAEAERELGRHRAACCCAPRARSRWSA